MHSHFRKLCLILATGLFVTLLPANAAARDHSIPLGVATTLKHAYPNSRTRFLGLEKEGGVSCYEIEVTQNGSPLIVSVAASGELLEEESAIALTALPEPVAAAVKVAVGTAKVTRSVRIVTTANTVGGAVQPLAAPRTTYEVKWQDAAHKTHEQEFDSTGKTVVDPDAGQNDDDGDGDAD